MAIPYADVMAKNIRAARARKGLEQEPLAERMRALGFSAWRRQTVASVEKSTRRVTAEEVLGLALALETSFISLLEPARTDGSIMIPSGASMLFETVHELIYGGSDNTVRWNDNTPAFPAAAVPLPLYAGIQAPYLPPPKVRRTNPNRPRNPRPERQEGEDR